MSEKMIDLGRNWQLDFLKGISCIVVVLLHYPLPGALGKAVAYAFRFPVPIFFMISGYFSFGKSPQKLVKCFFKMLKMIVVTELFYAVFQYGAGLLLWGQSLAETHKGFYAFHHPIRNLLVGSFYNGLLWYVYAMMWTYLAFAILKRFGLLEKCYILIPPLICFLVVGCFILTRRYGINRYIHLFRNAVSFGFPMTLLGYWVAEKESWLMERMNPVKAFGMIAVGGVVLVAEYIVTAEYLDFHFSTLLISFGIFLFALSYRREPFGWMRAVSHVGRKLSMDIYLSQTFFGILLPEDMHGWKWTAVLSCTIVWAEVIQTVRDRLRQFRQSAA